MRVYQVKLIQHIRAENLQSVQKMFQELQDAEPTVQNVALSIDLLEEEKTKQE